MGQDWFRKTTWTAEDQADFRRRLARARKKTQYLRIQAVTLSEQGKTLLPEAIALYDEVISQYPTDNMECALALSGRAECLEHVGQIDDSLAGHLQAIDHMRTFPSVRVHSPLDFAWPVARKNLSRHFNTALGLLDEFNEYDTFPVGRFKYYGSRALILHAQGEPDRAERDARTALAAAEEQTSGFRYHPSIGVVGGRYIAERALLAKIAGQPNWMLTLFSFVNKCLGH